MHKAFIKIMGTGLFEFLGQFYIRIYSFNESRKKSQTVQLLTKTLHFSLREILKMQTNSKCDNSLKK